MQELESRPEQFTSSRRSSAKADTAQTIVTIVTPSAPAAAGSADQQTSPGGATRPFVDFALRAANRQLSTHRVLHLLERWLPRQFELAEVVGGWIWIQFREKQPVEITAQLSQFGFHWNNVRRAWQHPCGQFRRRPYAGDPRERYASYFPADHQTA